jgi:hypothetical protein
LLIFPRHTLRPQPKELAMTRAGLTEKLLDLKREKGWSWKYICEQIGGMSPILVTGAILGQHKLTKPQAAAKLFGLSKSEQTLLNEVPMRGTGTPMPPTDPLLLSFLRTDPGQRPGLEGADRGGIRRRHHVGDRLRHGDLAPERSERRPRQDHHVGQIPAVQILRRDGECDGVWAEGGVSATE